LPFQSTTLGESFGRREERGQAWDDSDSNLEVEPPLQKWRRTPLDSSMEPRRKGKKPFKESLQSLKGTSLNMDPK
jgi:hypothetical protein